jgi:hypothetical protein
MIRRVKTIGLLLMIAIIASGGCAHSSQTDLVATRQVRVERLDDDQLEVLPPQVVREEGVVHFRGEIRRKPGFDGPSDQHVHLDLLDARGEWIDQIALHWQPQMMPTTGSRSARYEVNYFWAPPPGTLVRISVADDSHDTMALGAGGGSLPSSGAGSGRPSGLNTPAPGGRPRGSATHTPGTPRQPSQPRTPGTPTGRGRGGRR